MIMSYIELVGLKMGLVEKGDERGGLLLLTVDAHQPLFSYIAYTS